MGSFRRGLILALLPTPALAEVCDKVRPAWDGTPVTALGEALALFSTPLGLLLLLITALALRFRRAWAGLVAVLGWTAMVTLVSMADPTGLQEFAIAEGCIGARSLFIALVIAICSGTIIYTAPRRGGAN